MATMHADVTSTTDIPEELATHTGKALSEPMLIVEDNPDAWGDHDAIDELLCKRLGERRM